MKVFKEIKKLLTLSLALGIAFNSAAINFARAEKEEDKCKISKEQIVLANFLTGGVVAVTGGPIIIGSTLIFTGAGAFAGNLINYTLQNRKPNEQQATTATTFGAISGFLLGANIAASMVAGTGFMSNLIAHIVLNASCENGEFERQRRLRQVSVENFTTDALAANINEEKSKDVAKTENRPAVFAETETKQNSVN